MKTKSFIKRLTIYSSMITLLFTLSSSNINKKSKDYFRNNIKVSKGKIEYFNGTVYIGNENYLNSLEDLSNNIVLVLDEREDKDPNLKIYNSYKIIDIDIQEEIVEGLLLYEEIYPTNWKRSKESMRREWLTHNLMHFFGYQLDHTTDVDLNNKDEEKYLVKKVIEKLR